MREHTAYPPSAVRTVPYGAAAERYDETRGVKVHARCEGADVLVLPSDALSAQLDDTLRADDESSVVLYCTQHLVRRAA